MSKEQSSVTVKMRLSPTQTGKLYMKSIQQEEEIKKLKAAAREIADVAHHGGLMGFDDESKALCEIRRLSIRWFDKSRKVG